MNEKPGSFTKIDYRVRPAKQIERRMISEALSCLMRLGPMGNYWYAGMGSISFLDFTMIHRALGIQEMLSIEHSKFAERVDFNKPFSCIRIIEGEAESVLPGLDYSTPGIIWLDYDGKLDLGQLKDLGLLAKKMAPGSVFLATINCESGKNSGAVKSEADRLKKAVGAALLPAGFTPSSIEGVKYARVIRDIVDAQITSEASDRRKIGSDPHPVSVHQFLNFNYSDNARMCTLGWFVDANDALTQCAFDSLDFYRPSIDCFTIQPPVLTPKEIRHLNNQLPKTAIPTSPGLSQDDAKNYTKLYRYFPTYFEVLEA
ncbi:O-methyltransferase [Stenotrophomonas sp. 2MCAF14_2]|uniref:O-methyltransferase n=1 Tax=Stenotrophomonas sp. 2MCAF14_2 TaxID=3232983 RepID=UPI003F9E7C77